MQSLDKSHGYGFFHFGKLRKALFVYTITSCLNVLLHLVVFLLGTSCGKFYATTFNGMSFKAFFDLHYPHRF